MEGCSKHLLKNLERDMRNVKTIKKYKNKTIIERIEVIETLINDLSYLLNDLKDEIND